MHIRISFKTMPGGVVEHCSSLNDVGNPFEKGQKHRHCDERVDDEIKKKSSCEQAKRKN